MKAEDQKDAAAAAPTSAPVTTDPNAPTPHSGKEPESVGEGIQEMWGGVKAAFASVNPKAIGIVLGIAIIGGLWWYLARESRRSASSVWTSFEELGTQTDLEKFIEDHKKSTAGRVARLEQARIWAGPEGIAFLSVRDQKLRMKGIENLEKARDEFAKLADEFDDVTLKGQALEQASDAELALVGIPKQGSQESRGTVEKAVEYLRRLVKLCGEKTAAGEKFAKRANELESKVAEIRLLGSTLNSRMSPPPIPDIKPPADIKPPEVPTPPIPTPTPPPVIPPTTKK